MFALLELEGFDPNRRKRVIGKKMAEIEDNDNESMIAEPEDDPLMFRIYKDFPEDRQPAIEMVEEKSRSSGPGYKEVDNPFKRIGKHTSYWSNFHHLYSQLHIVNKNTFNA